MAFFARPNLDNTQFKQLEGTTLTISGQTQIASTSGLTLTDGIGGFIPIIATGGTEFDVLTYRNGQIILEPATASGGTGIYDGDSPTTCTVGGLDAASVIYGCNVNDILQSILVPTLDPSLSNPSISTFSISPTSLLYEFGTNVTVQGTTNFNPGAINPVYPPTACSCRTDGTQCYDYLVKGSSAECVVNDITNTYNFGIISIDSPNNRISSTVCYCSGTQPYDSAGAIFDSPLVAGATNTCEINICGIYPWYWGIESSGGAASGVNRPTAASIKTLINAGVTNKCVSKSDGTLYVEFDSTTDDYLWFATPVASTTKTWWYVDALNNNAIGGTVGSGQNLFPDYESVTGIESSNPVWNGQEYKIYISNYQSASSPVAPVMELRNN